MAMWSGSDPVISMERYNNSVLQEAYAFFSPGLEISRSTGIVVVSFPQFDGVTNLEPEIFQLQGVQMRLVVSFKIVAADVDMSLGSPGGIQTVVEQVVHLLGHDADSAENGMLEGKFKDEFRVYVPAWIGADNYYKCMLEEISIQQNADEPMLLTGTARFLWGSNPLG